MRSLYFWPDRYYNYLLMYGPEGTYNLLQGLTNK